MCEHVFFFFVEETENRSKLHTAYLTSEAKKTRQKKHDQNEQLFEEKENTNIIK